MRIRPAGISPASKLKPGNTMSPNRPNRTLPLRVILGAAALGLAFQVRAQQAPPPPPVETKPAPKTVAVALAPVAPDDPTTVTVLSPFEVTSARDTGYAATQTLAGTRIATDLKNVAAQVTVMTPEFLRDIGAVNLDEANLYSLNVENAREYAEDVRIDNRMAAENLSSQQRVRGLANASSTRDFFGTRFQLDGYNSERFTFSSGPNAILYGLGSPGGIIEQTLKRARFGQSINRVSQRFDDWGSYRTVIDFGRELIPGRVAVRAAAVYGYEESWKKPSLDRVRRQFMTATFRPLKTTELRVSYENIRREASVPRNTLPKDSATPFLNWRKARMQQLGITDPLDPRLYWAPNNLLNAGEAPFAVGAGTPFTITTPNVVRLVTGVVDPSTPASYLLHNATVASAVTRANGVDLPFPDGGAGTLQFGRSVTDESLFPYDVSMGGLSTLNRQFGHDLNVNLEQRIGENLFIEAAFNAERHESFLTDWVRGLNFTLLVDPNRYLPGITDAAGRPVLNPNRGRFYVESWGLGVWQQQAETRGRLSAAYKLDFAKRPGWTRWLGTHNFAGLFSGEQSTERYTPLRTMLGDGSTFRVTPSNGTNRNNFQVWHRVYLDTPGTPGARLYFDPEKDVTGLNRGSYAGQSNLTVYLRDPSLPSGNWPSGRVSNSRTDTTMFAVQSQFLQDKLVVTYGRSSDHFRLKRITSPLVIPDGRAGVSPWYWNAWVDPVLLPLPSISDNPTINKRTTNTSKGIVAFPLKWVSFHYNESTNESAGVGAQNPNGGVLPASAGVGKDYGLSLRGWSGKIQLKVNAYESSQTHNTSAEFSTLALRVASVENRLDQLASQFSAVGYRAPTTWNYPGGGVSGVQSDLVSKGTEITLIGNPLPNWRISLGVAKTKSVESNIAKEWDQYVASRTPEWQKFHSYAWTDGGNVAAGDQTVKEWIQNNVYYAWLDRAKLVDGRANDSIRKWRANLVSSYDFRSGLLKNFGTGGAVRWRDKAGIGYGTTRGPDGATIADLKRPYFDKGLTDIDGWVSYRTKLWHEKVRARFQLNVRNLFDKRDLLPQVALSDGSVGLYTIQAPRQLIFSADFEF